MNLDAKARQGKVRHFKNKHSFAKCYGKVVTEWEEPIMPDISMAMVAQFFHAHLSSLEDDMQDKEGVT